MEEKGIFKPKLVELAGRFYYSRKQRRWMDHVGMDRLFCTIGGAVVEYTQLIDLEALMENPLDVPDYDDAVFLGNGKYCGRKVAGK